MFNTVEFSVEVRSKGEADKMQVLPHGIIIWEGKAIVLRLQKGIYEVAGDRHFFTNGSKVYVMGPRPAGALTIVWRKVPIVLAGTPQSWYVFSLLKDGAGEELKYGTARIRSEKDRFLMADGSRLPSFDPRRGLELSKRGAVRAK